MKDLAWSSVTPRKHVHQWVESIATDLSGRSLLTGQVCMCGLSMLEYQQRQRRGRTNRSRGNSIERQVAKELGLTRVGHYGGAEDAGRHDEPFVASVKSGASWFSNRYWDQLKRLPRLASQTPILVVTDAPGPGHKRRAYVVVELAEWRALHGPDLPQGEELVGWIE